MESDKLDCKTLEAVMKYCKECSEKFAAYYQSTGYQLFNHYSEAINMISTWCLQQYRELNGKH